MRSAALYGALFVASVQGFQPMTSFHGRASFRKTMSARCAAGVMAVFLASPAWSTSIRSGLAELHSPPSDQGGGCLQMR